MVSDHWSNGSPSERTAGVSSRSITVTNKSNSLTYTVATVVGLFEILSVSNFGRVKVFPADHMHAQVSTTNSLSSGFIVDAAGRTHTSEGE